MYIRTGPSYLDLKKARVYKNALYWWQSCLLCSAFSSQVLCSFRCCQTRCSFRDTSHSDCFSKDRLPALLQHKVIYSFECACGCRYLGRTERRLEDRIREHVPKWLSNDLKCPPRSTRIPASAVTRHLQVCDFPAEAARSRFKVLFSSRRSQILKFLEALCIKRFAPDLCIQKEHVVSLLLPWWFYMFLFLFFSCLFSFFLFYMT